MMPQSLTEVTVTQ